MSGMFFNCVRFNQPLNTWNVSNVIDFEEMFAGCELFNQPLNNWNVRNARNMNSMFIFCYNFNQPLNNWNMNNVNRYNHMFSHTRMTRENLPRRLQPAVVNAQNIHRSFANVNTNKLNELFSQNGITIEPNERLNANFIREKLSGIIQSLDEDQVNKNNKMNGLNQIMTQRLNGINYEDLHP
jgi:surface protein